MSKVAIVTDSTTNLPREYMEKYVIRVAHATIHWEDDILTDGIDIQPQEFYERLETAKKMPTTSQATPKAFQEVYEELAAQGYDILTVVISSKLSGTVNSAEQAKAALPDANIEVVDSLTGSMGAGWPIIKAAEAAAQGANLAKCKAIVEEGLKHTGIFLMADTLEFLHRGGRIGGAERFLGTALNFKPIMEIVDGAFEGLERVRTHSKALTRLAELVEERIAGRKPVHLAALHANAAETAHKLLELAKAKVNPIKMLISDVTPAVGVHLGPGTAGLAFMAGFE